MHLHKSPMPSLAMTEEEAELASLSAAVRSARFAAEQALSQLEQEDERASAAVADEATKAIVETATSRRQ